ncbi:hypothetical protein IT399_02605 [Candidatus Nomurabacteria bacterium]|nr:hypothetical protein [Candidatus Nomurabacteria bacterium]
MGIYRGQIKNIVIEGGELRIEFAWLAIGIGFPPLPKKWMNITSRNLLKFYVNLGKCFVTRINSKINGQVGVEKFLLQSESGEVCILFSPDDDLLNPSEVDGLKV